MDSDRFFRPWFGLLVALIGVWVVIVAPVSIGSDGLVRFTTLDSLLRDGHLDRTKYSLSGPIAAAPLWYLGNAIGFPEETVWMFNRIVFLAALAALWLIFQPVLAREEATRFVVFLLLGSMFPWHMTGFFAEVFHVAFVGVGLALLALRQGSVAMLGGVLCVWGTVNVPATLFGLAFASAVLCWQHRRLRYLLMPACAAALILLENQIRRGNWFDGGYDADASFPTVMPYSGVAGFTYPFFFGLLSIFLSFGKGLVFFVPGLFARLPEEASDPRDNVRLVHWLWLAVVVGLVLVYARWWAWYGGAVWGPRFFLFASLPASLALARWTAHPARHSMFANILVLLATALSCWVAANGLVYPSHIVERFWKAPFELEFLTWYTPEYSVLWTPMVETRALTWMDAAQLAAFGLGFIYLACPTAQVLMLQLRQVCSRWWAALRSGPPWRI